MGGDERRKCWGGERWSVMTVWRKRAVEVVGAEAAGRTGVHPVQGAAKRGPGNAQAGEHAGTRSHKARNEGFVRWGMVTRKGVSVQEEPACG